MDRKARLGNSKSYCGEEDEDEKHFEENIAKNGSNSYLDKIRTDKIK